MGARAWLEPKLAQDWWLKRGFWAWAFRDVSWIFGKLAARRLQAFALGKRPATRLPIPVVVVGNVVAGGAGKTPLVIALVEHARAEGWQVGVVSRGYASESTGVREVISPPGGRPDAARAGDEAALIAWRTRAPVFVGADRVAAAQALLAAYPHTQLIISDDGLQHGALARDVDVIVFDSRGLGNGWPLPAGPLREPWPRVAALATHTFYAGPSLDEGQAWRGRKPFAQAADAPFWHVVDRQLAPMACNGYGQTVALDALRDQPLHAIAAIAQPQAFFDMLRAAGLRLAQSTALPDHSSFDSIEAPKYADIQLICTEKDALKLWNTHPAAWAVRLQTKGSDALWRSIRNRLTLGSGDQIPPVNTSTST